MSDDLAKYEIIADDALHDGHGPIAAKAITELVAMVRSHRVEIETLDEILDDLLAAAAAARKAAAFRFRNISLQARRTPQRRWHRE